MIIIAKNAAEAHLFQNPAAEIFMRVYALAKKHTLFWMQK
jgi:hypothetical protein